MLPPWTVRLSAERGGASVQLATRSAEYPYRLFGAYRLALAVMVLLSHSPGFLPDWIARLSLGNVGVFSFFVLSGFVISHLFLLPVQGIIIRSPGGNGG